MERVGRVNMLPDTAAHFSAHGSTALVVLVTDAEHGAVQVCDNDAMQAAKIGGYALHTLRYGRRRGVDGGVLRVGVVGMRRRS